MHDVGVILVWSGLSSCIVSLIAHEAGFRTGHRAGRHDAFREFYGERTVLVPPKREDAPRA